MVGVTDTSSGDLMTPTTDFVQVTSLSSISSSLTGIAELGKTYEVQYVAGISNESQFELLQHSPQTMQVVFAPTVCTTTGITGTFPGDIVYTLGTPAKVVDLTGIMDGDCEFSVSVDLDPADPFTGTLADIGLTFVPPTLVQDPTCLTWSVPTGSDGYLSVSNAD